MKSAFKIFIRDYFAHIVLFVFAGVALLFLTNFRPIAVITKEWKTTSSPAFGFSVSHPGIWSAQQYSIGGYRGDETVIFIIRSNFEADFYGIDISRQAATNPTLEEVAKWGNDLRNEKGWRLYDSLPGFEASELKQVNIDGYPMLRRVYRVDRGNALDEDVYIARQNDMIIITLRTTQGQYENFVDEFDRIVASFTPKE